MLHLEALADAPSLTPKQLAAKHGDEAARWALMQFDLRKRATKKYGDLAEDMLFEREALEQASSFAVARYHASQFPQDALVIDLTAGLGGDALALAARGPLIAYENDPTRAELLEFNLLRLQNLGSTGIPEREVRVADGTQALLEPLTPNSQLSTPSYYWTDPDRRSATGRRLTKPEDYTPNPGDLAAKLKDSKLAGIKLSPLLPDDYLESLCESHNGSLEFISHHGECLEAIIWLGTENKKPKRQAVILHPNHQPTRIEATSNPPLQAAHPERYIHDCDPAVVRAHCLGTFGLFQLGDSPGYLTSDDPNPNLAYRTYEVLGSPTKNQLKAKLQQLNARVFELKQRGTNHDPVKLLKEIKTNGDRPISLIAFRSGNSIRYVLTERLR
ncbi:MAG: hypothetical protein WCK51_05665 [Armatimonadota bacterium]